MAATNTAQNRAGAPKKGPTVEEMLATRARKAAGPTKGQVLADLEARDEARNDVIACPCCGQSTRASNIDENDQAVMAEVGAFLRRRSRDGVEALRSGTSAAMRERRGKAPRGGEQ